MRYRSPSTCPGASSRSVPVTGGMLPRWGRIRPGELPTDAGAKLKVVVALIVEVEHPTCGPFELGPAKRPSGSQVGGVAPGRPAVGALDGGFDTGNRAERRVAQLAAPLTSSAQGEDQPDRAAGTADPQNASRAHHEREAERRPRLGEPDEGQRFDDE